MSNDYDLGDVIQTGVVDGHRYKVVQNPNLGHFCGYVETTFSDEWSYTELNPGFKLIDCHGGLTYGVDSRGYIGFDCAHAGDVCILDGETVTDHAMSTTKEWTPDDVAEECERLARQIRAIETFAETFEERGWGDADV